MPHRDFDAMRAELTREHEPTTFALLGHTFTCVLAPRLADTFDLMDAPEPVGANEAEGVRALCRFIRRLLIAEDRPRWDAALRELGPEDGAVIVELATWLVQEFVQRPFGPPSSSSDGPPGTGTTSKPGDGATASPAASSN